MSVLYFCIEHLKKVFPNCCIDVVTQPVVKEEIEKDKRINKVLLYKGKKFHILNGLKHIHDLRKKQYDLTVILFTPSSGIMPSNVIWFTLLIKTKYRAIYNIDGEWEILPNHFFLKKLFSPFKFLAKVLLLLFI